MSTVEPGMVAVGAGVSTVEPGMVAVEAGVSAVEPGMVAVGAGVSAVEPGMVAVGGVSAVEPALNLCDSWRNLGGCCRTLGGWSTSNKKWTCHCAWKNIYTEQHRLYTKINTLVTHIIMHYKEYLTGTCAYNSILHQKKLMTMHVAWVDQSTTFVPHLQC